MKSATIEIMILKVYQYKECRGIVLLQLGRFQVEGWYCPPGFVAPTHSHSQIQSNILFLFGKAVFHRGKKSLNVGLKTIGRLFVVAPEEVHGFEIDSRWPLVFLNIQRWRKEATITSASVDLQERNK